MAQLPSVGCVVHYVSHGTPVREDGSQAYPGTCRAATVTEVSVDGGTVGLMVANPMGLFFHSIADGGVPWSEEVKLGGTWHWPERVGP
jgi:hypothetical protein